MDLGFIVATFTYALSFYRFAQVFKSGNKFLDMVLIGNFFWTCGRTSSYKNKFIIVNIIFGWILSDGKIREMAELYHYLSEKICRYKHLTPLDLAAASGNIKTIKRFLKEIKMEPSDYSMKTYHEYGLPLYYAAMFGHKKAYKIINRKFQLKNPPDTKNLTPLHAAASQGKLNICKLIIKSVKNKNPKVHCHFWNITG